MGFCVRIPIMVTEIDEGLAGEPYDQYDEAFIEKAVAIAHARTRSNAAIAASLCVPLDLLEEWLHDYEGRVEVRYIEDNRVLRKYSGSPLFTRHKKAAPKVRFKRCPKCCSKVVFEPVKAFEVQREEGVDIGTHSSIMDSGDDGIYGSKVPYVKITTELITRCPVCGVYTIRIYTDKLSNSEA